MGKHSAVTAGGANNHPPQPHAATHRGGGSDAIAVATSSLAGLEAAADKALFDQFFADLGVSAIVEVDDFDGGGVLTTGAATLTTGTVFGKGNWRTSILNSATLKLVTTLQDSTHRGILQFETTTNAAASAGIIDAASGITHTTLGSGQLLLLRQVVRHEDLSDGTNRYTWQSGWINGLAASPTDALMFIYSDNINSGNWTGRAIKASATTDAAGGTPVPVAADTWYVLDILWDGTNATFKVNGTTIGTIAAANVPVVSLAKSASAIRNLGAVPRLTYMDLIASKLVWSAPRAP